MNILKKILGSSKKPIERNLGRNDLCWCGSGKKYKRCHMESDENEKSRKLAAKTFGKGGGGGGF